MSPPDLLSRESRQLAERLRLWTPARWAAAAPGYGTRADLVRHLAQTFADQAAALEGGPPRTLPVLPSPLALPDQLAVTADDLVRAAPDPELARAAVAHLLAHRHDLLGDDVPAGLWPALGVTDGPAALHLGRQACVGPSGRTYED